MAKESGSIIRMSVSPRGRPPRKRPDSRRTRPVPPGPIDLLRAWTRHPDWKRVLLAIGTVLSLTALLSLHLIPDRVPGRVGDISTQEVRARATVRYIDREETLALQDAAASRVDPLYDRSDHATSDADETTEAVFDYVRRERALPNPSEAHLAGQLLQHVGVRVHPGVLTALLRDPGSDFAIDQMERGLRGSVRAAMQDEIRDDHPDDMVSALSIATSTLQTESIPSDYLLTSKALLAALIHPNLTYNADKTAAARDVARRTVSPIYSQIFAGDIVVRRGETVTPDIIDKLHALGLQNPRLERGMVISVLILVAIMVGMVSIYIARRHKSIYKSTKMLVLLSLLVNLSILGLKLADTLLGLSITGSENGYAGMLCVASAGMLIAVLINTRIGLIVSTLLAAQCGLILGCDVRFPVMSLLSTLVAIFVVSDIKCRSDLLRATVVLVVINIVLTVTVGRIQGDPWSEVARSGGWAVVSGLFAMGIFALGVAMFERLFGITTHLGLLELCDPNRPLLQEFCQIAPGTYTHSVMVGNLAVSAAESIGADALLCRVGAYYHDLGKMRRAEFFIENQCNGDNAHDKLSPSLSALVVTAHVKDGLEIAEQEKLPPIIKSFITEHHGTSLIRYFYHQHASADNADLAPGIEQHFRYAGPKPQSRETAILMLADGVEAASRTLERPTLGRIEDLVDKIIQAQLTDGQLDECDLTLRDLRAIRNAFVHLLGGMLHNRIEYPDALRTNGSGAPAELRNDKHGYLDKPANKAVPTPQAEKDGEIGDHSSVAA